MKRVHVMPFGAAPTPDGVRFALWAPTSRDVTLMLEGQEHHLTDLGEGWRRLEVPGAAAGNRYAFRVEGGLVVPDPASRFQPEDVHKESVVVDPGSFAWSDAAWTGRPWEEAVVLEVHVGTATREGTFAALADRLVDIRDRGINAVELMPIGDFPGKRGWGYDGVLPFAPDAAYGTPDDLKALIDRAHGLGLMMLLDVVYNHFGPLGNYLHAYARAFFTERHPTPWGAGFNFDGPTSRAIRDFFVHNALYWLEEFHFDGLRLDAVHAIHDESEQHILAELAASVRAALPGREIHLLLENDANEARWLYREDEGRPVFHTAQWNDDIHHCWHVALTGEADGYYGDYAADPVGLLARSLAEGFAFQGEPSGHRGGRPRGEASAHLPPTAFVGFLQNHDQVGNRAYGERLTSLVRPERLALARALLLLAPQIPMLFMGEEWGSETPFLYFVEFSDDPALSQAVRDGRRREFADFHVFDHGDGAREIPDPTDRSTFERSRIDWTEASRPPHHAILRETEALLALRQREIMPLTKTPFLGAAARPTAARMLDVTWRFGGGTMRIVANLGDDDVMVDPPAGRVLWASGDIGALGGGDEERGTLSDPAQDPGGLGRAHERPRSRLRLPPWTGLVLKGAMA